MNHDGSRNDCLYFTITFFAIESSTADGHERKHGGTSGGKRKSIEQQIDQIAQNVDNELAVNNSSLNVGMSFSERSALGNSGSGLGSEADLSRRDIYEFFGSQ